MINIAICEDDIKQLNDIISLIEEYKTTLSKDISYTSFESAIDLIDIIKKGKQFDIIFLDIIMPLLNGMEAAKEIQDVDKNVMILFLTSSSEFAVESYEVGAYYYALKPVLKDKFFTIMNKTIEELEKQKNDTLIIKSKDGISRILLSKLEYCEVVGKNIFYYLSNGKTLKSTGTFSSISDTLMKYPYFFKPHRSYIVNMNYIENINNHGIIMQSLNKIPIARGRYGEMRDTYMNYFFNESELI